MPVKKKPTKRIATRTSAAAVTPDPLWLELAEIEGINPNLIDRVAAEKVRDQKHGVSKRYHAGKEYRHPESDADLPKMSEQWKALYDDESETKGYGTLGFQEGWEVALKCETDLYNAWVRWYCLKHDILSPGVLSPEEFSKRYW